jgi:hypothetical protein
MLSSRTAADGIDDRNQRDEGETHPGQKITNAGHSVLPEYGPAHLQFAITGMSPPYRTMDRLCPSSLLFSRYFASRPGSPAAGRASLKRPVLDRVLHLLVRKDGNLDTPVELSARRGIIRCDRMQFSGP